ncbi:antitoxin [Commensalibacter oyaizuii]|uniref:Type II toxin-antitoxin system VapB family antitoxin n=1 Tax=Commensalibacter oyaizuii TaxID=3043873 RepID=A0ABT6Q421_9PROT|nr:type II toxin-antitoxin system VapB family antitoxin [Commensalibacter sp. TBRC 16381]MDI2091316.1 type II toxin-antitoxin system VapB family antitoxin [Commensalibacter sp. TBRC 16381]
MQIAKIFQNGRSQVVRLPKEFRFNEDEVIVKAFGNGVLLLPKENPWLLMQEAVNEFEGDFQLIREPQADQTREEIK